MLICVGIQLCFTAQGHIAIHFWDSGVATPKSLRRAISSSSQLE